MEACNTDHAAIWKQGKLGQSIRLSIMCEITSIYCGELMALVTNFWLLAGESINYRVF